MGFFRDTPDIFQRQIDFIQQSGIVSAMVGLLNAPKNTKLYERLKTENRLTTEATGNNTDTSMNFIPKMNQHELLDGYTKILKNIYNTKPHYQRIRQFLKTYKQPGKRPKNIEFSYLMGILKSIFIMGIANRERRGYSKLFTWTLLRRPGSFINAVPLPSLDSISESFMD